MDLLYLTLATLVFGGGFALAVASLRRENSRPHGLGIPLAVVGLIFQVLFLLARGELHGRCPITNGPEVLVFVSWSIVLFYLALGRAFRLSLLGLFSMPMVFFLQLIAIVLLAVHDSGANPPKRLDPWLELHASTSLLAYGAFGLAGIAGVMYLVQDHQLKSHKPGRLFYSLPPILYLSTALMRLLWIGIALLTIGIVASFRMDVPPNTLHLLLYSAVWAVYVVLLVAHATKKVAPRRFALWTVGAFVVALTSLTAL